MTDGGSSDTENDVAHRDLRAETKVLIRSRALLALLRGQLRLLEQALLDHNPQAIGEPPPTVIQRLESIQLTTERLGHAMRPPALEVKPPPTVSPTPAHRSSRSGDLRCRGRGDCPAFGAGRPPLRPLAGAGGKRRPGGVGHRPRRPGSGGRAAHARSLEQPLRLERQEGRAHHADQRSAYEPRASHGIVVAAGAAPRRRPAPVRRTAQWARSAEGANAPANRPGRRRRTCFAPQRGGAFAQRRQPRRGPGASQPGAAAAPRHPRRRTPTSSPSRRNRRP